MGRLESFSFQLVLACESPKARSTNDGSTKQKGRDDFRKVHDCFLGRQSSRAVDCLVDVLWKYSISVALHASCCNMSLKFPRYHFSGKCRKQRDASGKGCRSS